MTAPSSDAFRVYTRTLLLWALLPTACALLLNLCVDPLRLLDFAGLPGLTLNKPMVRDQERLFKPFAVVRQQPQVVFLGSSRSNHALDPRHPALAGLRVYNLSLSGTNVHEMRQMFEHAVAAGALQQAVIELDIGFFSANAQGASGEVDYLDSVNGRHPGRRALRVLQTAMAWDTLALSWGTLRGQHADLEYTDLGRQGDQVFEGRIAHYGGVRNTFEGYMTRLVSGERELATDWHRAGLDSANLPGMSDLRAILDLARRRGIAVKLYLSPAHAMDATGSRQIFGVDRIEAWRRALLQMIGDEERLSGGRFVVPLWDFSGFNSVTTESPPASQDQQSRMANYWDQSHYRKRVGDWILDRLYDWNPGAPPPADFGVRLTAQNMETHFASERAAADNYALNHPDIAAFVAQLTHQQ